ncbi:class I SAM-dependent methyltransferase [Candidatus Pacearchaeota archaeon]|nr:class I SAM-dependent methyltransferase [Candidatus Pacearchaeota archaeon]
MCTLHHDDSRKFLNNFAADNGKEIRIAFLDGSHLQNDVLKEFEIVYPKLSSGGIVIFDNSYKLQDDEDEEQRVNGALRMIMESFREKYW